MHETKTKTKLKMNALLFLPTIGFNSKNGNLTNPPSSTVLNRIRNLKISAFSKRNKLCFFSVCASFFVYDVAIGQCNLTVGANPATAAICPGGGVNISATSNNPSTIYTWSPSNTLSQDFGSFNTAWPNATTTYTITGAIPQGAESIPNGDFELGTLGFSSSYTYVSTPGSQALYVEGTYTVADNPANYHHDFPAIPDHSAVGSNYLIVNGSISSGRKVWCQSMTVIPGQTYIFSCWATTIVAQDFMQLATLNFDINGTNIGPFFQPSFFAGSWTQYSVAWICPAGVTNINLCIENTNTTGLGNDFGLDDISFRTSCSASTTATINVLNPSAFSNSPLCSGQTLNLSTSPVVGATYSWSGPTGYVGNAANVSTATPASGTYTVAINMNGTTCNASTAVTVLPSPTAAFASTSSSVCSGTNATVNFTGTASSIIKYRINNGTISSVTLNSSGTASISTGALTANATISLVSVERNVSPNCLQSLNQSITITVLPNPTVAFSGGTSICSGTTSSVLLTGTPNAVVNYTLNGSNVTTTLDANGSNIVYTGAIMNDAVYSIVNVAYATTPACPATISSTTTVTVIPVPTASISGGQSVCSGADGAVTFSGTANAIVTYSIDGSANQTITLNSSGNATLPIAAITSNKQINLVSVQTSGANPCSINLSGSTSFTVTSLTGAISGTTTVCAGSTAPINFTGSANAQIIYTINGGTNQTITLDNSGVASVTTANLNGNVNYSLVSVSSTVAPLCTQTATGSAIVSVITLPTASISAPTIMCPGASGQVTFTGTPGATVSYTVDGGTTQTIILNASGTALLSITGLTATTSYQLTQIQTAGSNPCSQSLSGSATIAIATTPNVSLLGTATICPGSTSIVYFSGTPNGVVSYKKDNGAAQSLILDNTGNATITTPALTANTTYSLISVSNPNAPACTNATAGSVVITVAAPPSANVTSAASICSGLTANLNFSGTPNAVVTYNLGGGTNQTVSLNANGTATVLTGALSATTTCNLIQVETTALPICAQNLSASTSISVVPLPTATILGSTSICPASSATISFNGTPSALVYYNINNGAEQTIPLNLSGNASLQLQNVTQNTQVNLLRVEYDGNVLCGQNLNGSALVSILPISTITLTSLNQTICSGDSLHIVPSSSVSGTTYSWNAVASSTELTGYTASGVGEIHWLLNNSSQNANAVVFTITPKTGACVGTPATYTVTVNPLANSTFSYTSFCEGQSKLPIITGEMGGRFAFNGAITDGTVLDTITGELSNAIGGTTYQIRYTVGTCKSTTIKTVQVIANPKAPIVAGKLNFCDHELITPLIVSGGAGDFEWYSDAALTNLIATNDSLTPKDQVGILTYYVREKGVCVGPPTEVLVKIEVCDVIVYSAFTPDNDGVNDTWEIKNLDQYFPNNEVRIYNRWGNLIFSSAKGKYESNPWNGKFNGDDLPVSSFYYVIEFNVDYKAPQTGSVSIVKK